MELWQQIISSILYNGSVCVTFPQMKEIQEMFQNRCYVALEKIRQVIHNEELDDAECFQKIEEIICAFEEIGSNGGARHDF